MIEVKGDDVILEKLVWLPLKAEDARTLAATILGGQNPEQAPGEVVVRVAGLSFYAGTRLAWLLVPTKAGPIVDVFALVTDETSFLLDGSSVPVHAANAEEELELTAESAPDYLRFFLFAVRGDGGPFLLVDEPPAAQAQATRAQALEPSGVDEQGRFRFRAVIAYEGAVFKCTLAVSSSGEAEMLDDEPTTLEVPPDGLPTLPDLKRGALLAAAGAIDGPSTAGASDDGPLPPVVSVLRVLVQLLLEEALAAQATHTLLQHFNATTSASSRLSQFAKFVLTASPVVAIESTIPFVEEEVAQIVLAQSGEFPPRTPLVRGRAHIEGGDDTRLLLKVPDEGPAIVLIPFHSYRSIVDVERVAHEIASREISVFVGCERVRDLPDSLQNVIDLTLRLPDLTPASFETMFRTVMGAPPPADWTASETFWAAHVLHTDLQQPRHLGLPPAAAFAYVRDRVTERLRAVDPLQGPGLADLHGLGEARQFARDLIADIHEALTGRLSWHDVDRGVLLVGAPGTGKTTLARAIAKDCRVKFVNASAASWQAAGHLGDHIRAIRADFAQARRHAPAILFIDEIDSVGNREQFTGANAQYSLQVVNAVLEQMQTLDPEAPVIVIAATNDASRVDPALRRAGRLDRSIQIPYPNVDGLVSIFQHYLRLHATDGQIAADIDVRLAAELSLGSTGADVELMVRGAARRARKAGRAVTQTDLIAEITGKPRDAAMSLRLTTDEIDRLSVHEAGHALARCLSATRGADITFVSIVPRSDGTLGFVASAASDRTLMTRREYMEQLEVVLAGRAAEELRFSEDGVSGGAGGNMPNSDLAVATRMATQLVGQYGLGSDRKFMWTQTPTPSQLTQVEQILRDAYGSVMTKLRGNEVRLLALAQELRRRQEMTGADVRAIVDGRARRDDSLACED